MAKKYIDAERLKSEIERLYDGEAPKHDQQCDFDDGYFTGIGAIFKFIDSFRQEQPNDVRAEIKEYYGEDLAFEDERTKAAYHFFSAGKAFELREYEEERGKHITDLLDNFQKGMNAGYEKAISELKEGKVECSPVMKELIDKLFNIGNVFNFGFGPKNFQQEQPEVDLKKEIITQWSKCNPIDEGMGSEYAIITVEQFDAIARHFYELGRLSNK